MARSKRAKATNEAQAQLRAALDTAAANARSGGTLVAERVTPVAVATKDKVAEVTKDRVVPAVRSAAEHAGPALEKGYNTALERATPVVNQGRDKVVDDFLPKLAEAVAAASAAAIAARDNAVESAQVTAVKKAKNLPANKRKRRRRRFLTLTVLLAAVAGAAAAWKARSANQDPWSPDPAAATYDGAANGSTLTPTTPAVPVEESDPIIGDAKDDH